MKPLKKSVFIFIAGGLIIPVVIFAISALIPSQPNAESFLRERYSMRFTQDIRYFDKLTGDREVKYSADMTEVDFNKFLEIPVSSQL